MGRQTTLVTGAAGFIGAAVTQRLLSHGEKVVGIDNLNAYYNPLLKEARLNHLSCTEASTKGIPGNWVFHPLDIGNGSLLLDLFKEVKPQRVVHLAAQAGVRYSLENPGAYAQSNLVGMVNILEGCRHQKVEHLVYASSSSVYGGNSTLPFTETQAVNHPVSLYAATKKANELMAHAYSHLYKLPATGLRFFTVYGPWGRPDMAPVLFAKAIKSGAPIRIFNEGHMRRDFTYIDDIVEGVIRCLDKPATPNSSFDRQNPDPSSSWAPHRVFNIGNAQPVELLCFVSLLEQALGREAIKIFEPMQPGDVVNTSSDTSSLQAWVDFSPSTPLERGVESFAKWIGEYENLC